MNLELAKVLNIKNYTEKTKYSPDYSDDIDFSCPEPDYTLSSRVVRQPRNSVEKQRIAEKKSNFSVAHYKLDDPETLVFFLTAELQCIRKDQLETVRAKPFIKNTLPRRLQYDSAKEFISNKRDTDYVISAPVNYYFTDRHGYSTINHLDVRNVASTGEFFNTIWYLTKNQDKKSCVVYCHQMSKLLKTILEWLYYSQDTPLFTELYVSASAQSNIIFAYECIYRGIKVTFLDIKNLIAIETSEMVEAFGLPASYNHNANLNLEQDYADPEIQSILYPDCDRMTFDPPYRDKIFSHWENYRNQVRTMRDAYAAFTSQLPDFCLGQYTIASAAMACWREMKQIQSFPTLAPREIRAADIAYSGPIIKYNESARHKTIEGDFVLIDNNSLYPAACLSSCAGFTHPMPWGPGTFSRNPRIDWHDRNKFFIIHMTISAKIKPGYHPFLRWYKDTQRVTTPTGKESLKNNPTLKMEYKDSFTNLEITRDSIMLRLIEKYYDITSLTIHDSWEYSTRTDLFDEYMNHWIDKKIAAKRNGNEAQRQVAKFFLNSLTGKFGQQIQKADLALDAGDNGERVHLHPNPKSKRKPTDPSKFSRVYLPIGCAIFSYSKEILFDMMYSYPKEHFYYCDTDSNIMTKEAFDNYIDKSKISDYEVGLWKVEHRINKLRIAGPKCYMYTDADTGETIVKCSGLPASAKKHITYENFYVNDFFDGPVERRRMTAEELCVRDKDGNIIHVLQPTVVLGGIAPQPTPLVLFTPAPY